MQITSLKIGPIVAAVAALTTAGTPASADPNPYYIGVSQAITRDTNVYRTPDSTAVGDTYSSTGLLAGINQPFGRQRFYANGSVRYNRFSDQDRLNNTSYGLNTGLDLSTVNHISGGLNYSANQSLSNYSGGNILLTNEKNLERSQQLLGRAAWGLVSLLTLEGTATHRSIRYSSNAYRFNNIDQDSGSIGLTYRPSSLLSMGVAYRATQGKYPNSNVKFDRDDIDLTGTWTPTGQSSLSGRLSFGKQDSENTSLAQNSITSGSLAWDYRPTGKLGLRLWASRDTGVETSFFNFDTVAGNTQTAVGDNSTTTNTFALSGTYLATAKITVNAAARLARRTYDNTLVLAGGGGTTLGSGSDSTTALSLSATYQALRSLQFACGLGHEKRTNSGNVSYPYNANTASCSAQFTLQ